MNENLQQLAERLFAETFQAPPESRTPNPESRSPVHVVYGGAHLFKSGTIEKLGKIALAALETYAPNFIEFAEAVWLPGADSLPTYEDLIQDLEFRLADNPERVKSEHYEAWFAWTVYNRVIEKLKREPVEDFRIDFEDGYGFRADEEEDAHAVAAAAELAQTISGADTKADASSAARENARAPVFCGFRIKSFQAETYRRAVRTLDLFLTEFTAKTRGKLPRNFVVTLPKITSADEVRVLARLLEAFEKENSLAENSIRIEIMIETPEAVRGLREIAEAARERTASAHFGAYDYTASFGIAGAHQHLQHDACRLARQLMQLELAPLGIRLSDSVTTEMPVPVHRGENLSERKKTENKVAVHKAWRRHYNNVTCSLINGFYQSWDLHPAQLVARYAAVYAFFLESAETQAARLANFIGKATQALVTKNQFDDAASAQGLLNFFARAVSCGALTEKEVREKTGLSAPEIAAASFARIMQMRNEK